MQIKEHLQKNLVHPLFVSQYFERKTAKEKERIFQISQITASALVDWSNQFPSFRQIRIDPLALTLSATHPIDDPKAIFVNACMNLWIFAVDDQLDESNLPIEIVEKHVNNYKLLSRGAIPPPPSDELGLALNDIRKRLGTYPLFKKLESYWAEALSNTLDSMLKEFEWREQYQSTGNLPNIVDYLENGLYSVGGPPHLWTAFITINDPSLSGAHPELRKMEKIASKCIRLANDWQSYEKEIEEGSFNSLTIWKNQFAQHMNDNLALERSQKCLIKQIVKNLETLKYLRPSVNTNTGFPEKAILNIAEFVCGFYMQHDFHTFIQSNNSKHLLEV